MNDRTGENNQSDDAEGVTLSLQVTIFSKEDEVELAREINAQKWRRGSKRNSGTWSMRQTGNWMSLSTT